jgi:serine/threonine-protein kinase
VLTALEKLPADRFATAAQFAEALTQRARPPSPDRERGPGGEVPDRERGKGGEVLKRRRIVLGAGSIALVLGLWAAVRWARRPAPPLDPNLVAVAPFEVLHQKLDLWREGLVDVLSRDMDGAGILRTVPLTVVLRHWRGRADPAAATELGRRTGARLALFGTVAPEGPDSVRFRGTVLDVGTGTTLFEIERVDHADRIDRLGDSVTVDVLRDLGRTAPGARIRLVSAGTRSLPALKAFLRGEQFFRRFSLDSAIGEYERAVEFDSTYALALNRLGLVHGWTNEASDPFYLQAGRFNHNLAPRDSLLITSDSLSAASVDTLNHAYWAERLRMHTMLEEAARRYVHDPEVWYRLGEARYHGGYRVGSTERQVREAFDSAITLDSTFAPAYIHAVQLALSANDAVRASLYANAYMTLTAGVPEGEGTGLVAILVDPRRSQSIDVWRHLDNASANVLTDAANAVSSWPDSAETAIRLSRLLATGRPGVGVNADTVFHKWRLAYLLSYRGHLRESYALTGNRAGVLFADLALVGVVPPDTAAAVFRRWLRSPSEGSAVSNEPWVAPCARTLGAALWWASRHDTASLLTLLRNDSLAARSAVSVRAVQATLGGYELARAALALARLDSANALRRFMVFPDSLCVITPPDLRIIRFRLLLAAGRNREAMELLDQWSEWARTVSWVLGSLEAGRVAERLGDREGAIRKYQFVADVWRNADPELQPYVAEARAGLRRLSAEPRR